MNKIDQKIKNILQDLETAHKKSEKFLGKELIEGQEIFPVDFYDMAVAFENEARILIDLELAMVEKFPKQYTQDVVASLKAQRESHQKRARAFQNRQMPIASKQQPSSFKLGTIPIGRSSSSSSNEEVKPSEEILDDLEDAIKEGVFKDDEK
jgi:polyhydroxyalkanoate synthesis regulator phasin